MTMREPATASATIRTTFKRADAYRGLITPEIARSILGTMVTHQRPLTRGTVERYKRILQDDEWKYTGQGVIIATNGVGLDAQHRLTAISESGIAGEMLVVLDVDPGMWRYLDQGKPRSGADLIGGGNAVVTAAVCRLLQEEEAGSYRKVIRPNAADVPLILDLYPEVPPAVEWAVSKRKALQAPVGLAAYAYVRARLHDAALADRFFESWASGVDLSEGAPVLALRNFLAINAKAAKKLSRFQLLTPLVRAWTAAVEQRQIAHVKAPKRNANLPAWPGSRLERLPRRLRAPLRIVEEPISGS